MKKVIKSIIILFSIALFIISFLVSFENKIAFADDELRWKQMHCTDGSGGTYEICFYSGDGNTCDTWGERTRDCIDVE